jgi:hypothetical protein
MKKILFATTLLVVFTASAFADGKKSNAQMFNDLKTALKTVNESAWVTSNSYKKASFQFNGKSSSAFVNLETNELIGFSISIDENALPAGTKENVDKKFHDWKMLNPIMFITSDGRADYYVQVIKNGKSFALSVSPKGKVSVYSQIQK